MRSELLVSHIQEDRGIETALSAAVMRVHTIKTRELEYLLTGSDRYLSDVVRDRAQVTSDFAGLRRQLAHDPEQFVRLVAFQAAALRRSTSVQFSMRCKRASGTAPKRSASSCRNSRRTAFSSP